jgi:hypothetical protein
MIPRRRTTEHFEIYAFTNGATNRDGIGGAAGIDFDYGIRPFSSRSDPSVFLKMVAKHER